MKKKRPKSDQAFTVDKDGNKTNSFLYELTDGVKESEAMREQHRALLRKMGLSEEQIKAIT
jgi:hypothetical protein